MKNFIKTSHAITFEIDVVDGDKSDYGSDHESDSFEDDRESLSFESDED